ncbi:MAG TPA: DUF6263 family protein [Candidatus Limnocylindrales bacterium]|nr:DUF6263 family protein [Candidatus Limnocylindrales bacterium]
MKKLVVMLPLCALAGGLLLTGCSKSKNAATTAGNNRNGTGTTATSGASDKPVDMKIKWTVGRKYPMRIELTQSTTTEVPDQPQPVVQEMNLSQGFDISALKELENGGRQLELKFETETMNVSQGGTTKVSFDSLQSPAQDANNPVAPVLRAMIGARIQYFTDANGKVERMEGVNELAQRVAATGNPQAQASFQQMFSEDTLKRYGSFADSLPGHTVNIGDTWPFQEDVSTSIGVLTVDVKYTFKNWEQHGDRQCAHVDAAGDISTKTISTANGMVVEIKKGTITGEFWFDPVLGMIVEANNNQDLALKITTRQQTMSTQFNQKVRMALVDMP